MSTLHTSRGESDTQLRAVAERRRLGFTILGALAALVLAAVFVLTLVVPPRQKVASSWPSGTWETATPEKQGLDSARLADALAEMQSRHLRIHSLTLIRNG